MGSIGLPPEKIHNSTNISCTDPLLADLENGNDSIEILRISVYTFKVD